MIVHLTRTFRILGDVDLETHADLVFENLLALEGGRISDADMSGILAKGIVSLSVHATGDSFDDASSHADGAIRSAIHAAGGSTPNWQPVSNAAELIDA